MNDIKNITISIVVTTIVVGLCELLLPKNEFKNQMRLITGTILLLCLISPLTNNFSGLNLDFRGLNNNVNVTQQTEKSVATSLNYEIKNILKENGVENGKVIIKTCIENESININEVIILFYEQDKNRSEHLTKLISDKLEIEVKAGEYNE